VRVVISTYDAICSFFGSGVQDEGDASDVSGTVTSFRALSKKNELKQTKRVFTLSDRVNRIKIIGGSNNLGGGLIEWLKQCFYSNEQYPYEIMEEEANVSDLGAHGLIFLPYLMGERAPLWNEDARGIFFGLERIHTRMDIARAVFESTGFILASLITAVEETGVRINKIYLSGGLARNNLISQLKADICGKDTYIMDDFETTAAGAAILVLVACRELPNIKEAAERFSSVKMIIKSNPFRHKKYRIINELYDKVYETNKELYGYRKEIIRKLYRSTETTVKNL
jgi:xylulokinase